LSDAANRGEKSPSRAARSAFSSVWRSGSTAAAGGAALALGVAARAARDRDDDSVVPPLRFPLPTALSLLFGRTFLPQRSGKEGHPAPPTGSILSARRKAGAKHQRVAMPSGQLIESSAHTWVVPSDTPHRSDS
jgi:hypothetical protein